LQNKSARIWGFARGSVSLYSTEEHAICDLFLPRWNRAAFPRVSDARILLPAPTARLHAAPQSVDLAAVTGFADGDEVAAFYGALTEEKRLQFSQLNELIELRDPASGQKVVDGYTGMPRGFDRKPMLVFGRIGRGGRAMNSPGRIPLVDEEHCPLTVVFRSSDRATGVDETLIAVGSSGCWRPTDLTHFLQNPSAYLR